jgi:hypothetical protein
MAAARSWAAAGILDADGLRAALDLHPGVREPQGWWWRVLVFFFAWVGLASAQGSLGVLMRELFLGDSLGSIGLLLLLFGGASLLLAEAIAGRDGPGVTGADAACSLMAIMAATAGAALVLADAGVEPEDLLWWLPLLAGVALALAAWRYGYRLYAAGAAACLFLTLARLDAGRVLWILAGAGLTSLAWRLRHRPQAPPHRECLAMVLAVSLCALYLAVNLISVDRLAFGDLDHILRNPGAAVPWYLRLPSLLATGLLPLLVLAWGLRARSRLLLVLGILLATLSLATLRWYVHLVRLEFVLILAGAGLVMGVLALSRWLRHGPAGERGGFTAAPLFDDVRREDLLKLAAAAAVTPGARDLPREEGFRGAGGGFGGGGAGARY